MTSPTRSGQEFSRRTMLPTEVSEVLGETHAQRINSLVSDIVTISWDAAGETDAARTPLDRNE